jgi:hypothetical protein
MLLGEAIARFNGPFMNIRLTLMRVGCERCLIGVKLTQKGKPFSATLKHQFWIG